MKADSQRPKEREADLNAAIEALDLAKTSSIPLAKAAFVSAVTLLKTIKVRPSSSATIYHKFTPCQDTMVNRAGYAELGLSCADVCQALEQRTNGRKQDELSPSVNDAVNQLTL